MPVPDLRISELRERLARLPGPLQTSVEASAIYRELLGFAPPCDASSSGDGLESKLRGMHEQMRVGGLIPPRFDAKTAHLILLAMMLMSHGAQACAQGAAARRAGASWDDLRGVVALGFLLHGLLATSRGDELLAAIAEWEHKDHIAGAVAAYG